MTIKQKIQQWLGELGADGLCSEEDCGCSISGLFPCDSCPDECVPATLSKNEHGEIVFKPMLEEDK